MDSSGNHNYQRINPENEHRYRRTTEDDNPHGYHNSSVCQSLGSWCQPFWSTTRSSCSPTCSVRAVHGAQSCSFPTGHPIWAETHAVTGMVRRKWSLWVCMSFLFRSVSGVFADREDNLSCEVVFLECVYCFSWGEWCFGVMRWNHETLNVRLRSESAGGVWNQCGGKERVYQKETRERGCYNAGF